MVEAAPGMSTLAFLLVFIGLPAATWAHISLMRELEQRIRRCKNCPTCKMREEEERAAAKNTNTTPR